MINEMLKDYIETVFPKYSNVVIDSCILEDSTTYLVSFEYEDIHGVTNSTVEYVEILEIMAFVYSKI